MKEDNAFDLFEKLYLLPKNLIIKYGFIFKCPYCGYEWEPQDVDSYICPECGHYLD